MHYKLPKKLEEVLKDPNDKVIAFDLDGTLCEGEFWGEDEPKPIKEIIDFVWELYKSGAHIIIYTSRQIRYSEATYAWLDKHEVPYHGVMMNRKPGADLYVDDKTIRPDELREFFK